MSIHCARGTSSRLARRGDPALWSSASGRLLRLALFAQSGGWQARRSPRRSTLGPDREGEQPATSRRSRSSRKLPVTGRTGVPGDGGGGGPAAAGRVRRGGRATAAASGSADRSRPDSVWRSRRAGVRDRARAADPKQRVAGRNSVVAARARHGQSPRCAPRHRRRSRRRVAIAPSPARRRLAADRGARSCATAAGARLPALA